MATIRDVLAKASLKPADVAGVGLTGQMHGSVFLDETGNVIRPALLWNDQRTALECAEIERRAGGREALVRLVGNPALTGFTAPKLLWLRTHEPANWDRVRRVLLPKDYVRYRLTGAYATDVSDASGTLMFDVANRRWSSELLSKLEIDPALLPECYESPEIASAVSAAGSQETGLAEGHAGGCRRRRPTRGRGGQRHRAGRRGVGDHGHFRRGVRPHGGAGFRPTGPSPARVSRGAWGLARDGRRPGGRRQLSVVPRPARAGRGEGGGRAGRRPVRAALRRGRAGRPGAEGLFFLPYLTGERTPHFDPDAKGAWIGLTVRHGRPHLIRSVLEGATFAMRDSLELIREMGVAIQEIRVSGGGARNALWRQIQADIYGHDVCTVNANEGPAFGASLLAQVGTGAYSSVPEACDATIQTVDRTPVDPPARAFYDRAYDVYRQLYPALRPSFRAISELAESR